MRPPLRVFYSYSHRDEALRDQLQAHLSPMERQGLIRGWHDRRIGPGDDWSGELDRRLEEADLILLLISPDFIASDYCHQREMQRALQRHRCGEAWVVPILLRPVDWRGEAFARLQGLPIDLVAVTEWPDRDQALREVARGLRGVVQAIRATDPGAALDNARLPPSPADDSAQGTRRLGTPGAPTRGNASPRGHPTTSMPPAEARPGTQQAVPATPMTTPKTTPGRRPRTRRAIAVTLIALLVIAATAWGLHQQRQGMNAWLEQGRERLGQRELDLAEQAYAKALAGCWWGCADARLGLEKARIYAPVAGEYRPDAVAARIDRLLVQHPDDPHLALFQGDLAESRGDLDGAEAHYREALERDDGMPYGWFALGVVLDHGERPREALEAYRRAVNLAPENQSYLTNLAHQQQRNGDLIAAVKTLNHAIRLDDGFILAHIDRARLLLLLPDEAAVALQGLQHAADLLLDPDLVSLPKNSSPWYLTLGEHSIHLDTPARKRCYTFRMLASLAARLGDRDTADRYATRDCALPPSEDRVLQEWLDLERASWANEDRH